MQKYFIPNKYVFICTRSIFSGTGDILAWAWLQGTEEEAKKFQLEVKIRKNQSDENDQAEIEGTQNKSIMGTELCARSCVYSLKDTKWKVNLQSQLS